VREAVTRSEYREGDLALAFINFNDEFPASSRGRMHMNHFERFILWGMRMIVALVTVILGLAGAHASLISHKSGWEHLSLLDDKPAAPEIY
jgi:flagellar biosynthesis/type III secretory pathway M-ring protein FliF/YscJ